MIKINKAILYTAVISFILLANIGTVWGTSNKQVLFIGSYSYSFESFNKQIEGFETELAEDIYTHIEYLDYGNYPTKGNEENFYNLLEYKMDRYTSYEAIVLAEDPAIRFWEKYKDDLFKGIPVIFMGSNDEELVKRILQYDNVYGISEEILLEESIELINSLHPNSNIVALTYVESDTCEDLEKFYSLKDKHPEVEFSNISVMDDGVELAKEKFKELPSDTVIIELYTQQTNSIGFKGIYEVRDFLDEEVNNPMYGTINYDMNKSFIGGIYTDPIRQGIKAAQITNDIVNDKKPATKFIEANEVNSYSFNYDAMKRFDIEEKDLPKDSIIIDKPISIWESDKEFIIGMISIGISLFIIILILINSNLKKIQYEKEILKAKKIAENAHNAQSNFISTVSHELRTPVAVIMSCSQLLDLNLEKLHEIEKEDTKYLDTISQNSNTVEIVKQNCNRMLKIVNNIIDVAKYDSRVMDPKFNNVEIISFLEAIVELVIPYANSKNIELIFDTECEEHIMAVDPYMIERILLNLLSNAIKFSKEEGNVLISVYIDDDNNIVITVDDDGIGIEDKDIEKIFERFVQVDDTMNRKNEGSGIGLSLVKSLVQLHGGDIVVSSLINKGTIFTIKLPIRVLENESVLNYYHSDDNYLKNTEIEFSDIL